MFSTLRTRFGIPGVISVIALVFAMLGGAYAAASHTGGKATVSAKAKRGPKGPRGATGPAGPQGPAGPTGPAGKEGASGVNGVNGKSVVLAAESKGLNCKEGGTSLEAEGSGAKKYACNGEKGKEGSPWTAGGVLPPGQTETGTWVAPEAPEGSAIFVPLSFPIALEEKAIPAANAHFIKQGEFPLPVGCGGTVTAPEAEPGNLCVFTNDNTGNLAEAFVGNANGQFPNPIGGPGGIMVVLVGTTSPTGTGGGSWAVTAAPSE